ncbi:MFS transporter [Kytococcus sedentarius]|uniref:MFS transporter n=1 Tax=Kytococcus sedentarius TaxID=1276 RepID=UPI0035BC6816
MPGSPLVGRHLPLLVTEFLLRLTGFAAYTVLIAAVYEQSRTPAAIGYLGVAIALPALAVALWIGRLVKRYSSRSLLVTVTAVRVLTFLVLAASWTTLPTLIALAAVNSLGHQLTMALKMTLDAGTITAEERGEYLGTKGMVISTTVVLGPAVGGLAFAALGASGSFLALGTLLVAALVVMLRITGAPAAPREDEDDSVSGASSWRHLRGHRPVFHAVVLYCLVGVILESEAPLVFPFLVEQFGSAVNVGGYFLAVSGLGGILGGWVARRRYADLSTQTVTWLVLADGVLFALFTWSPWLPVSAVAFFGLGIMGAVTLVIVEAAVQEHIDSAHQPFVFSVMQFSAGAGGAALGVVAAALAARVGTQPVFFGMAASEVVLALGLALIAATRPSPSPQEAR